MKPFFPVEDPIAQTEQSPGVTHFRRSADIPVRWGVPSCNEADHDVRAPMTKMPVSENGEGHSQTPCLAIHATASWTGAALGRFPWGLERSKAPEDWRSPKPGGHLDDLSRGRNASQRGVALVITLLMLAVVTFMAVAFLTLSRRERGSVSVTQEVTVAKSMADMALARAQAETIARMIAQTNMAAYDFMVSTNYINPGGFNRGIATNPANGNYTYTNGQPLNYADQIILLTNLYPQFDPRPPVFYGTNDYGTNDFRFYWDFNRNGRYEPNGTLPEIDYRGQPAGRTNFYVGDPEFIGVLDKLDLPH